MDRQLPNQKKKREKDGMNKKLPKALGSQSERHFQYYEKKSDPFFSLVRPKVKTRDLIFSWNTDLIFDLLQRAALLDRRRPIVNVATSGHMMTYR